MAHQECPDLLSKSEEQPRVLKDHARRRSPLSSSRSSAFKWQQDTSVIGALQVPSSDLDFEYKGKYIELPILNKKNEFVDCLSCWNGRKLKRSFIEACDGIPPSTQCCGLINDSTKTIRDTVSLLNQGWVKAMNKKLRDDGFKISCFAWTWFNASGETTVLLIRFHCLSIMKFNQIQNMARESSTVKAVMLALHNLGKDTTNEEPSEEQEDTHHSSYSSSS
jgi:hypothetical protein